MTDRLPLYDAGNGETLKLALRPKEAAAAIGVCERTLLTLRQQGRIRGIRLGSAQGATVLYRVEELRRFLEEAEAETGSLRNAGVQGELSTEGIVE